jgi:hypothetical protein
MPKQFYTEKDIEELVQRGVTSLQVTDEVVLTELAYEKARRMGLQLVTSQPDTPPGAPVRPYLSENKPAQSRPRVDSVSPAVSPPQPARSDTTAIEQRIRLAVIAKLGNQVDAKLLDNIIHRVVKSTGLK